MSETPTPDDIVALLRQRLADDLDARRKHRAQAPIDLSAKVDRPAAQRTGHMLLYIGEYPGNFDQDAATKAAAIVAEQSFGNEKTRFGFFIAGFDNDPRELWDIPEVTTYTRLFLDTLAGFKLHPTTLDRLDDETIKDIAGWMHWVRRTTSSG